MIALTFDALRRGRQGGGEGQGGEREEDARVYGTVLTIDRSTYKLRLFKGLKFSRSYGIAIGMAGFDTPSGLFTIQSKQVDPAWHVPEAPGPARSPGDESPAARRTTRSRRAGSGIAAGRHPRHGRGVVDRHARLARLHPDARGRRHRPVRRAPVGTSVLIK